MKRLIIIFLFIALMGLMGSGSSIAKKNTGSGNGLYESCTSESNFEQGVCLGFVKGFIVAIELGELGREKLFNFCIPPNVTVGQGVDIFVNYLRAHPESRHLPASAILATALIEAFPCL
jgi:hypothetical protein